ncbi:hypothetical protein ES288_D11G217000v1 [Gossypium darwinii]|uniref:Uncharacterized protein n=1 Tax=Gossypium darwinii TaxID=34276 RepID=A0A5D2AP09_GOSDA|nr:hypothetical protein ES288_D11G217000v1 [Gossypium darwinii]
MHRRICPSISSFLMTIKVSPSTHTYLKPNSLANETALRHALASAMVEFGMFSYSEPHQRPLEPTEKNYNHEKYELSIRLPLHRLHTQSSHQAFWTSNPSRWDKLIRHFPNMHFNFARNV